MADLDKFRERVKELRKRATVFDGRAPTQADLAEAIHLDEAELSTRLRHPDKARLTSPNIRAIVSTLAAWEAITTQAEALELLALMDCPDFSPADWQAPPLDMLTPPPPNAPPPPLAQGPTNVPVALTSFVGRDDELAAIRRLLTETRALTLLGPGGCGKTRLALESAGGLRGRYSGGVWLVELADLADPLLVPGRIAAILGLAEQPGCPLTDTLVAGLAGQARLLILDNCEHLIAAVATLVYQLLLRVPLLRVLATSREPLLIPGEVTLSIAPLPLPPAGTTAPPDLQRYDAVRLFVERARLAQPAFALTATTGAAVQAICSALDGIPLALELAAARLRTLSLGQLREGLGERFALLIGGARTALPRQQTLQALFDWSYDLLTPVEQTLFRRLAVFAGGWTLAAAGAVAASPDQGDMEVLATLAQLIDKSLVGKEERGAEVRYRMLETIRQYGAERLSGDPVEAATTRARHLAWGLALAESAAPELSGPGQTAMLARLETEHDNLRAALGWGLQTPDGTGTALRLGIALGRFWSIRGHLAEGRRLLDAALDATPAAEPALRARALYVAGNLAADATEYSEARARLEASLALRRTIDDRPGIAATLQCLGRIALDQDNYAEAQRLLEESLALARAAALQLSSDFTLIYLGRAALLQGHYAQAVALFEEACTVYQAQDNIVAYAVALTDLGIAFYEQAALPRAQLLFTESHTLAEQIGYRNLSMRLLYYRGVLAEAAGAWAAACSFYEQSRALANEYRHRGVLFLALSGLSRLAAQNKQPAQAIEYAQQSLRLVWELGYQRDQAELLEAFAALVAPTMPEQAAWLLGAAAALRQTLGAPVPPILVDRVATTTAAVRATLPPAAFADHWQIGQALTGEQAVEWALQISATSIDDGPKQI